MSFQERFIQEIMLVKDFARELKSWKTVFYFFFPWSLYLIFVGLVYFLFPPKLNMGFILITFFYLIPPAGKESMVPAGVILLRGWLGPWSMPVVALSIAFVDTYVGLWMMWNWDLIKLIPFLGSYIRKLEQIGEEKWRKHKHLSHLAYLGIALFVAFPFQGSGGVGATVIGRILGMNRFKVFYSIVLGSIFGCFLIAFLTYFAIFSFENVPHTWLLVAGIIIFVIVLIIAIRWMRGAKK